MPQTTRLTVDLADDEYRSLKIAVATAGKGVTMSSVVRSLVRDHLEALEDRADVALVEARREAPVISGAEARSRFVEARSARR
ncbi:MAG: hypothetical protein LBG60_09480 [Bifidobacteriaceae bacterium]|jgi:siroheme synthase (precorrin-2 oxidase/ferrochelatase)|nr:hypothetical protein [Bifidobacteriaceae bacterium]